MGFCTGRNLSLGTKCEPQGSHSDPVWVLRQGQKSLLCLDRCHCPGIVFDLPARCFSRKINQNKFSAQPQTPETATSFKRKQHSSWDQEGKGFLLRQGRNPFLVTDRNSPGFPPEQAGLSLPKKAKRAAHSGDGNQDSICKQRPAVKIFMVKC